MNSPDTPGNERLHRQLAAHVEHVHATTDLTGPVIARAGRIRRRRHALAATGATAAVLAVSAPFVWWNLQGTDPTPVPATTTTTSAGTSTTSLAPVPTETTAAPTTTPAATATPVPTGDADAVALRVTVDPKVPVVTRPELPYLLDATLHREGRTVTLAAEAPAGYLPLADGRGLVLEHPQGGGDVASVVDADGQALAELPAAPGQYLTAATNDAGTMFVLYDTSHQGSEATATLTVHDQTGARLHEKRGIRADVRIAGFVGERIFLTNTGTGRSSVWDLATDSIDSYTPEIVAAVHEGTGLAAIFPVSDFAEERCTTIADVTGAHPVPVSVTCGAFQPTEFSPDGRHLLGLEVPFDGMLQSPSRVIEVVTGRAVVTFDEQRPLDMDSGFLPDGSVVLNLVLDPVEGIEQNALLRCTLDGACSRLTETVPMPEFGSRYATRYAIVRR